MRIFRHFPRLIEKKGITKSHKIVRTRAYVAVLIIVGQISSKVASSTLTSLQGTIWTLKAHSMLRTDLFETWLGLQHS